MVVVVGGGLAGGLTALRLHASRPDAEVTLLEGGDVVGGDHTWCLHGDDLDPADVSWVKPLLTRTWPGYDVRFPGYARVLPGAYHALRSPDFHRAVTAALGSRVRLGVPVAEVQANGVRLADGTGIDADLVVDARGDQGATRGRVAFQKFFGLFVRTAEPHQIGRPLLMDATVPQDDGFRFFYVLPWSDRELLVEDTRFSANPELPELAYEAEVRAYLRGRAYDVVGRERGVLPLPLHGAALPAGPAGVVRAGVGAGLYHPTTGYSFPDAVRFASWLAAQPELTGAVLAPAASARAARHWRRATFCRRLNSMMFLAAAPAGRRRILAQFYRRDAGLIRRFYGGRLSLLDQLKILTGKPPVPMLRGLRAFGGASFG